MTQHLRPNSWLICPIVRWWGGGGGDGGGVGFLGGDGGNGVGGGGGGCVGGGGDNGGGIGQYVERIPTCDYRYVFDRVCV